MVESGVRSFNSAKKFAEEVIHPLIKMHAEAKIRSKLGALNEEEASKIPPNVRVIKRFNAMKERLTLLDGLFVEVEATVRLNGRKSEISMMKELQDQLRLVENNYEKSSEDLIKNKIIEGVEKPYLTDLFREIGIYLDRIYIQLQGIMTKNKLLFAGDGNEFSDDEELREKIKIENRSA